jgi:hypothetical protein
MALDVKLKHDASRSIPTAPSDNIWVVARVAHDAGKPARSEPKDDKAAFAEPRLGLGCWDPRHVVLEPVSPDGLPQPFRNPVEVASVKWDILSYGDLEQTGPPQRDKTEVDHFELEVPLVQLIAGTLVHLK